MLEDAVSRDLTSAQLDTLGDEIATFAARIDVAEHALITRLRAFDAHEAWGPAGFKSCAEWLSWRIGVSIKAAREKVRVARALGTLQKVDALFGRGELSYSKVRAITRVATLESEQAFQPRSGVKTSSTSPHMRLPRRSSGYPGLISVFAIRRAGPWSCRAIIVDSCVNRRHPGA
jgi:hypothetical protein